LNAEKGMIAKPIMKSIGMACSCELLIEISDGECLNISGTLWFQGYADE